MDELDPSFNSYYSLYSLEEKFKEESFSKFDFEYFYNAIITDPTMQACAGPERTEQFFRWSTLSEYLFLTGLSYPDIIQGITLENIEEWISQSSPKYKQSIKKITNHFYEEFKLLTNSQRIVAIQAKRIHGSITYGIMLALGRCDEMEYSIAILASHCIFPLGINSEIDVSEYKQHLNALKLDSLVFKKYLDLKSKPDKTLSDIIRDKIPTWSVLPRDARYSLMEAIKQITMSNSEDYSPYVVSLGKSLEITLKKLVFDKFQRNEKVIISSQQEITLLIEQNKKISRFIKFLLKEPHFIELGSMLVILEYEGGKTSKNNIFLRDFFIFIYDNSYSDILNKTWVSSAKELARQRNIAAHSKRFSLEEAKELMDQTFELISKF
tara:strand:+ start:200 stop:1342 length:1143 start_codon:yes stop_codon:yes gene_type:complete